MSNDLTGDEMAILRRSLEGASRGAPASLPDAKLSAYDQQRASELAAKVRHDGALTDREAPIFACFYCHSYHAMEPVGIDPQTREMVTLFQPRRQEWSEHFRWQGATLLGRTPIGQATLQVLCLNHPDAVAVRDSLRREGVLIR